MDMAIIADDLTGAADCGVQFVRSGYRTAVAFRGSPVPPSGDVDAVVVDTDSRALTPRLARKRVLKAGRTLMGTRIAYKKLDSTLRGPVAAELEAALEATGRPRAVVAPAFPSAGRSTRDGVQMVHGEPVCRTGLTDDSGATLREDHIPSILAEAGLGPIATLKAADYADGETARRALGDARWVVADAETEADLEALVRIVPDPSGTLWAGSAGLALALGRVYPGLYASASCATYPAACNVLTVVGSTNEVARGQLRRLSEDPRVLPVPFNSLAVAAGSPKGAIDEALTAARATLGEGGSAVLYSTAGEEVDAALGGRSPVPRDEVAGRIADALAEVVAGLSEESLLDALILTGGDTAVRVARRLGAAGILLEGEFEPGVPIGTLLGPEPHRVVTKAGGFGSPDTLRSVLSALLDPRKDRI